MFQNLIISNEFSLDKFFNDLNFNFYLTKPQIQHIKTIVNSMFLDGYKGKINDVSKFMSYKHRTCISRFLSESN